MTRKTRERARKNFAAFGAVALALALAACGRGTSTQSSLRTGALALEASVSPSTPRVGENQLALRLRDARGKPIAGAQLSAAVRMAAMGAMAPMGGAASMRELGDGSYQADFALDMPGTWRVEVNARAPSGESLRAEGSLTVGREGLRLALAGAGGANATPEAAAESPGAFTFPVQRIQKIGVRTTRAERKPLARSVRANARVAFDERALADVSPKVTGWVESLGSLATGDPVTRGQTLLTLYSPELYAAQREYQQALASRARAQGSARPERADDLVRAAERRLALLGIAAGDIAAIAKRGEPLEALPLRAPASGFVIEKNAVLGGAVNAGDRLLRIAPSDRVWLEAAIAESDLALVREGAAVRVVLADDTLRTGHVARVLPQLAAGSRTATARIVLDPPGAALRPEMWATVELDASAGEGIVVPSGAVLRAGERSFVFVARGGGHFEPRAVTLGFETGDVVEIRSGLSAGEEVVSEGTYLIASESRLRAAIEQW